MVFLRAKSLHPEEDQGIWWKTLPLSVSPFLNWLLKRDLILKTIWNMGKGLINKSNGYTTFITTWINPTTEINMHTRIEVLLSWGAASGKTDQWLPPVSIINLNKKINVNNILLVYMYSFEHYIQHRRTCHPPTCSASKSFTYFNLGIRARKQWSAGMWSAMSNACHCFKEGNSSTKAPIAGKFWNNLANSASDSLNLAL